MQSSQKNKALRFVEQDLIRYVGDDEEFGTKWTFICLPLNTDEEVIINTEFGTERTFKKNCFVRDYNSTTYKIFKNIDGRFECNCQGWQTAQRDPTKQRSDGVQCAHVLALFFCFKIKRFGKKQGATEEQTKIDVIY